MAGKKVSRNAQRLLTVREIFGARDGDHSDGGGLYLRVRGASASWLYRFTAATGRRREMGLGAADRASSEAATRSVDQARSDADAARKLLAAGQDPIDARDVLHAEQRAAQSSIKAAVKADALTLARAGRAYHEKFIEPHLSARHAATWISSLETHIPPATWHKPIAQVEAGELLDVMLDLYGMIPETASRIRQRLEAIFDDALLRKLVATNPAAVIRRNLNKPSKRQKVVHLRSLPYRDASALLRRLEGQEGVAARALRLLLLTASRTGEILGANRDEFDVDARTWRIAGARMKAGEDHVVYLNDEAMAIVREQLGDPSGDPRWLFPSPTGNGKPLSNMGMLVLLRRMKMDRITTAHGLRACDAARLVTAMRSALV